MRSSFEYLGEWWSHDHPDRRFGGTLAYSPSRGLKLKIVGCFSPNYRDEGNDLHEIVHGQVAGAGNITLLNCWEQNLKESRSSSQSVLLITEYGSGIAFIGAHFERIDQIHFRKISVNYTLLSQWIMPRSFKCDHRSKRGDDSNDDFGVVYRRPNPIELTVGSISITLWSDLSTKRSHSSIELAEDYLAHFVSSDALTISQWHRQIVSQLQNFLTFATGSPSSVAEFIILIPEINSSNGTQLERRVKVVQPPASVLEEELERYQLRNLLFSYSDVADRLNEVINDWIELSASIQSGINLLLGTMYHQGRFPFIEMEFLSIVQAVESYHRCRRDGHEIDENMHQIRIARILDQHVDNPKDRRWLKRKLKLSNNKSLSRRLEELLAESSSIVDSIIPDRSAFAERVAGARNFLSHFDKELEQKRLNTLESVDALDTLVVLLQALLLRDLGFSEEDAGQRIRATARYRNIGQREVVNGLESD